MEEDTQESKKSREEDYLCLNKTKLTLNLKPPLLVIETEFQSGVASYF